MDKREQVYEKYATMFPKTVKYVKDNLMEYIRCFRCNSPVLRQPETGEDNPNEYPYQCMWCNENLDHLEVYSGSPATAEEVELLIRDVIYTYDIDMEVEEEEEK